MSVLTRERGIITGTSDRCTSNGTLLDGFEDLTNRTLAGAGGTMRLDRRHKQGQCGMLLEGVNGVETKVTTTGISQAFTAATIFSMWVWVDGPANFQGSPGAVKLYLWTTGSNGFYVSLSGERFKPGWNHFCVPASQFTMFGTAAWTDTFTKHDVRVTLAAAGVGRVVFDDLRYGYAGTGVICLRCDDNYAGMYTLGLPILQTYQIPITSFCLTNAIGAVQTPPRQTLAQVHAMQDSGLVLHGSHTKSHPDLRAASDAELIDELGGSQQYLIDHDLVGGERLLAYPFNYHNGRVIEWTRRWYDFAVEGSAPTNHAHPLFGVGGSNYRIKCHSPVFSTSEATILGYIDAVIARKGFTMINMHDVGTGSGAPNQILTATFANVIAYIRAAVDAGTLEAMTVGQYLATVG